eukprot:3571220-Amphidinium_carterae.1
MECHPSSSNRPVKIKALCWGGDIIYQAVRRVRSFCETHLCLEHGVMMENEVISSKGIAGAAFRSTQDQPPVRRSHPFPPGFVICLERMILSQDTSMGTKAW